MAGTQLKIRIKTMDGPRVPFIQPTPLFAEPMECVERVRALAEDVLHKLGPGLSESIYQHALSSALRNAGHVVENERVVNIYYEGVYCGFIRADVIVDQAICLELKAKSGLSALDTTQAITYLTHCSTITHSLLINFGSQITTKLYKRDPSGVNLGGQDILHTTDGTD